MGLAVCFPARGPSLLRSLDLCRALLSPPHPKAAAGMLRAHKDSGECVGEQPCFGSGAGNEEMDGSEKMGLEKREPFRVLKPTDSIALPAVLMVTL